MHKRMRDAGDEKDGFVARDHHKREIEVKGGQGEAGPYLALVLQVEKGEEHRGSRCGEKEGF